MRGAESIEAVRICKGRFFQEEIRMQKETRKIAAMYRGEELANLHGPQCILIDSQWAVNHTAV